jgi:hypothetical protein
MPLITARAPASPGACGDDRIALFEIGDMSIFVVADGAGGLSGGAVAADLLIDVVRRVVSAPVFAPLRAESWVELLGRADVAFDQDLRAGETTAVVVAVSEHGLVGASAGDSGAWVVHPEGVDDLTAAQHKKLRLGTGRARPVSYERPSFEGTLLVTTDGLLNYASPSRIAAIARQADLGRAVRELVDLVRLPSGELQDDVGVVLARGEM